MTVNVMSTAVTDGWPIDYAIQAGLYKKYGLNVSGVTISAAGEGAAEAAQSGHLDFATGAAEYAGFDAAGGTLKDILTVSPRYAFELYAKPDITSIHALAGKTLGVAGLTGSFDVAARVLFKNAGLDPNSVTYINLSNITSVESALLKGTIDAAMLIIGSQTQEAAAHGFRLLANLSTLAVPVIAADVYVTTSFEQAHPAWVKDFVTATMVGIHEMEQNKAMTLSAINKFGKGTVPESDLSVAYNAFVKDVWSNGQVPEDSQIADLLPILAESNPAVSKLTPGQLVDPSFASAAAARLGFGDDK